MTWKAYYCKFAKSHWIVQEQFMESEFRDAVEGKATQKAMEFILEGGALTSAVRSKQKTSFVGTTNQPNNYVFSIWVTEESWYIGQEVERLSTYTELKQDSTRAK